MCQRVITAVRGDSKDAVTAADAPKPLLDVYEGKITFEVRPAGTAEGKAASAKYKFGDLRHGLVGLNEQGEAVFTLPGHNYDRAKIVEMLDAQLK